MSLLFQVIPQLIARIDTPRALVGRLIHQLLTDIGRYHPQVSLLTLLLMLYNYITKQYHQWIVMNCWILLFSRPGFDLPTDCGLQVHHHSTAQRCEQNPEEHVWTLQHVGSAGHDGRDTKSFIFFITGENNLHPLLEAWCRFVLEMEARRARF